MRKRRKTVVTKSINQRHILNFGITAHLIGRPVVRWQIGFSFCSVFRIHIFEAFNISSEIPIRLLLPFRRNMIFRPELSVRILHGDQIVASPRVENDYGIIALFYFY